MSVLWVTKEEARIVVKRRVAGADVVLDIGTGIRPQTFFRPRVHICVEPHLPYLERLRHDVGNDSRYIFINCTWDIAMKMLLPKSVDTVFALDFVEHLEKADGFAFLREAERVARRQIVVYTPLGFYPQTYKDPKKPDRWGMDGGYWQAHRSGWYLEDFGKDWELICCEDYILVDQNEQPLEKPFGAMWAFRTLSEAAQDMVPRPLGLNLQYKGIVEASLKRFLPHWAYGSLRFVWRVARCVAGLKRSVKRKDQ